MFLKQKKFKNGKAKDCFFVVVFLFFKDSKLSHLLKNNEEEIQTLLFFQNNKEEITYPRQKIKR